MPMWLLWCQKRIQGETGPSKSEKLDSLPSRSCTKWMVVRKKYSAEAGRKSSRT